MSPVVRLLILRVVVLALVVLLLCGRAMASDDSSRLAKLDSVRRTKSDGVLSLSKSTFRKYIESAPRSYSLFVLFTTVDQSLCKPCGPMRREFAKLAQEYYSQSRRQASRPVFFGELKLAISDQDFLADYRMQHVPVLYFFESGASKAFPAPLALQSPNSFDVQTEGFGVNAMKMFVNKRSGARMKVALADYRISFVATVQKYLPMLAFFLVAFTVISIYCGWNRHPMFWFGCVLLVYMYSIGGGHFCWINDSPIAVINRESVVEYISPGSRNQFVAEGALVAMTCILMSALIILIYELPTLIPDKASQTAIGLVVAGLTFFSVFSLLSLYTVSTFRFYRFQVHEDGFSSLFLFLFEGFFFIVNDSMVGSSCVDSIPEELCSEHPVLFCP